MDDKTQRRILLVDDEANQRRAIGRVLMDLNADIIESENGKAALETARTFRPDLVILDILMPEMDGFGFIEALNEKKISIPLIYLTSDIQDTVKQRCLALGAKGFLNKPAQETQILGILKSVLG